MQRFPVRQPFLLARCHAEKLFTFSDLCSYVRILLQCLKQRIRQDLFAPKTPYIVFTAWPPVIHSLSSARWSAWSAWSAPASRRRARPTDPRELAGSRRSLTSRAKGTAPRTATGCAGDRA